MHSLSLPWSLSSPASSRSLVRSPSIPTSPASLLTTTRSLSRANFLCLLLLNHAPPFGSTSPASSRSTRLQVMTSPASSCLTVRSPSTLSQASPV
mmetsp:Transcript_25748/g.42279  ORF Transcript_25748/g.42279 Transcript_25748/m.42279 type:complete len:95 (+) Transcript_25748:762-1046(+)